jgi:hypothetical protein
MIRVGGVKRKIAVFDYQQKARDALTRAVHQSYYRSNKPPETEIDSITTARDFSALFAHCTSKINIFTHLILELLYNLQNYLKPLPL